MSRGVDPESRQVGRRLKALRIESGLEVEEVARRLGVSMPSWYAYERGLSAFPHTRFADVAGALGVTPRHLIERLFPAKPVASSFSGGLLAHAREAAMALVPVDRRAFVSAPS